MRERKIVFRYMLLEFGEDCGKRSLMLDKSLNAVEIRAR
jgi:hypothetical protein